MRIYQKKHHPVTTVIVTGLLLIALPMTLYGEGDVKKIEKQVDTAIDILQKTQEEKDKWMDSKDSLTAELEEKKRQADLLEKQQRRLHRQVNNLKEKIAESSRRAEEVERIRLEMAGFLDETFSKLSEHIASEHLPFLEQERKERMTRIEDLLIDDSMSVAEKFRRLMEALQIEVDYGRAVEVVREPVWFNGGEVMMDVLRIGRLSLFSQTSDGSKAGFFDHSSGRWQPLPDSYRRNLRHAIDVANKIRPVEMINLPIGRINKPAGLEVSE